MLTITKPASNRVDISITGAIDADMMRAGLTDLIAQSAGVTDGHMLYTIDGFELPSLGAIAVEMSMLPQLFTLIGKFSKCAVLCDTAWVRTVGEWEGKLIPGLAIKGFELTDRDAAESWLAT